MRSPRWLLGLGVVLCLATASLFSAEPAAVSMATAATKFLASLTPEQLQRAQFAFDSEERTHWHFIPNAQFQRSGLLLFDAAGGQRQVAYELLATGLSQRGNLAARNVMEMETVLRLLEEAKGFRRPRDPLRYFVSVFGQPSARGTWGWRVEGHHLSLQFTIVNGQVTVSTPTFFGVSPAEVLDGDRKGLRVLGFEEDAARSLLSSLSPRQLQKAVVTADAPEDILTMNQFPVSALSPSGLTASEMTPRQREELMALISAYSDLMTPEIANARLQRLKRAGVEKIAFAWAGSSQKGQKHYYRVQGPTFLIEYDNTQDDANHIHSVWRDFDGDFGRDLLREHLRTAH